MDSNANRLNLDNMVERQLNSYPGLPANLAPAQIEKYFEANFIETDTKNKKPKKPKTSIASSLNSIVLSIHKKIKDSHDREFEKSALPPMEDLATTNDKAASVNVNKEALTRTEAAVSHVDPKTTKLPQIGPSDDSALPQSISKIKVKIDRKNQQSLRRQIGKNIRNNEYASMQRVREIQNQKRVLQGMLLEQQRIQSDRQRISGEIRAMRVYLTSMQEKLDHSLKKLNSKNLVSEQAPRPRAVKERSQYEYNKVSKMSLPKTKPHNIIGNGKIIVAKSKSAGLKTCLKRNCVFNNPITL